MQPDGSGGVSMLLLMRPMTRPLTEGGIFMMDRHSNNIPADDAFTDVMYFMSLKMYTSVQLESHDLHKEQSRSMERHYVICLRGARKDNNRGID